jgi:hypothetical protein
MDALKRTPEQGLGIPVMLGMPDLGRGEPEYPLAVVTFEEDDFFNVNQPIRRLGQIPQVGNTVSLALYLFADSEVNLLGLVDRLRAVREQVASITVQEVVFTVRYGATKRGSLAEDNPWLAYTTETAVTLSHV